MIFGEIIRFIFSILFLLVILLFMISSIVLFIKNFIQAKRTGKEIKKGYKIAFTISLGIILFCVVGCVYLYASGPIRKSICSADYQVADAVHYAVLTAMMDPDIKNSEEYFEDLNELTSEFDITQYKGDDNCILTGAAEVLGIEDMHKLSGMIRTRGATGRILVTVYEPGKVRVVLEGTEDYFSEGEISIE